MQLTGKLIQILPLQTGEGKNGVWKKQDIILETDRQYGKKLCVTIWGDKINKDILVIGETLDIFIDLESREYNGKWYTDVKAWKIESTGTPQTKQNYENTDFSTPMEDDGDVPF